MRSYQVWTINRCEAGRSRKHYHQVLPVLSIIVRVHLARTPYIFWIGNPRTTWGNRGGVREMPHTATKETTRLPPGSNTFCFVIRAILIEQRFFQFFLVFFQEKQEKKQEKQETFPTFGILTEGKIIGRLSFPKLGNLTEGKIIGRLRIPILGKKYGKYWNTKFCANKNVEF